MKKKLLTIIITAITIILTIVGMFYAVVLSLPLKDCGSDSACFRDTIKICKLAKVRLLSRSEATLSSVLVYAETKGTPENCSLYYKIEKVNLIPVPELMVEQTQVMELEGKDMICAASAEKLLEKIFTAPEEVCEGTLIDTLLKQKMLAP